MDPSAPLGFSFDQLDDAGQANAGNPQGDGWPAGIALVPVVIPKVQALAGIPNAAIIGRSYGVAVISFGIAQTTVDFLTIATGGAPAPLTRSPTSRCSATRWVTPSVTGQSTLTCPPFFSAVTSRGVALNSAGSKAINGTTPPDYSPAAVGVFNNTICSSGCTAGYEYDILLSSTGDDDGDGLNNAVDDCPTVADPAQTSFAGIGTACAAGQGYDNNDAGALAALAGCALPGHVHRHRRRRLPQRHGQLPVPCEPTQKNNDGDGRGDACEGTGADPTIAPKNNPKAVVKGIGTGYKNGRLPGITTSGQLDDHSDICKVTFTIGGTLTPPTTCLAFGPTDSPPGPGFSWQDSNNDGVPDFLCAGTCTTGNVTRDHKSDANQDGYSDADEGTPANCGAGSCGSISTKGTAETNSCQNGGRNCGTGPASGWDPLEQAKNVPGGVGTGCLKTLDETTSLKTTNLARSDADLDGSVSILDLSKIASWFGNSVTSGTTPAGKATWTTMEAFPSLTCRLLRPTSAAT